MNNATDTAAANTELPELPARMVVLPGLDWEGNEFDAETTRRIETNICTWYGADVDWVQDIAAVDNRETELRIYGYTVITPNPDLVAEWV